MRNIITFKMYHFHLTVLQLTPSDKKISKDKRKIYNKFTDKAQRELFKKRISMEMNVS